MNMPRLIISCMAFIPALGFSMDMFYCPQNSGYIKLGMSPDQVIAACGQPISKKESNQPVMQRIPVTQLIYANVGANTSFYGAWQLPIGNTSMGVAQPFRGNSTGNSSLEVDIANDKVISISLNSSSTNAVSICPGANIEVGSPASSVYGACGSPSLVNNTFINQPIQSDSKPKVWVYQANPYQAPISLTFVNGKLQSIN